jgi:hypothetical protein
MNLRLYAYLVSNFKNIRNYTAPKNKNLVISTGGVGTTFLIDYISRFIEVNQRDDSDFLKHMPRLDDLESDQKIIFLKGDMDDAVNSIVRRGWVRIQASKLGNPFSLVHPAPQDLLRTAMDEQSKFFLSLAETSPDNVLVIEYNDIWDQAPRIANFLCIEKSDFVKDFPKRKARSYKNA